MMLENFRKSYQIELYWTIVWDRDFDCRQQMLYICLSFVLALFSTKLVSSTSSNFQMILGSCSWNNVNSSKLNTCFYRIKCVILDYICMSMRVFFFLGYSSFHYYLERNDLHTSYEQAMVHCLLTLVPQQHRRSCRSIIHLDNIFSFFLHLMLCFIAKRKCFLNDAIF